MIKKKIFGYVMARDSSARLGIIYDYSANQQTERQDIKTLFKYLNKNAEEDDYKHFIKSYSVEAATDIAALYDKAPLELKELIDTLYQETGSDFAVMNMLGIKVPKS
ncbi:hypothetical protein [Priestia filamentosa]|uniref:hypothetical protein n=1 Tax=Priestia filamentosa TaxID=1402861 RepID=UPI000588F5DB|nr:hypothetical protein [Priestia filamentosa]WCM17235.1 hypothetical protein PGN40_07745 [Priestia filamentosa]